MSDGNEKLEAFKAALHALCVEHGVHVSLEREDWDYPYFVGVAEAYEDKPAGLHLDIYEMVFAPAPPPMTPEEIAQREAEHREWRARVLAEEARRKEAQALWIAEGEANLAAIRECGGYLNLMAAVEANATESRKKQMRVSTEPTDPAYIDARPRKAWVNDELIEGWTVADEFRRVVITPDKVHHGSVLIERLPALDDLAAVMTTAEQVADGDVVVFEGVKNADIPQGQPAVIHRSQSHGKRRR